ncbi:MAG: dihydropteroate synthase [Paludibacteraceae bacterium]|nr:dihydropteroate synthase [Paludibacteraceae bacterium]
MNRKTISFNGSLVNLENPLIMAILNVTPDSFFSESRCQTERRIHSQIEDFLKDGADIIDVGACSTRPNAKFVNEKEEMARLGFALDVIRKHFPDILLSIDTFRSVVAKKMVEDYNVAIVNDISGGELDKRMFDEVARLSVPYVLTHSKWNEKAERNLPCCDENFLQEVVRFFSQRIAKLNSLGLKDVILDLGFGFSKSIEQNYFLLKNMSLFNQFDLPLLIGVSRKSMICKLLQINPNEALNGTTVLNVLALNQGVNILRVHDVKEARETINLYQFYKTIEL